MNRNTEQALLGKVKIPRQSGCKTGSWIACFARNGFGASLFEMFIYDLKKKKSKSCVAFAENGSVIVTLHDTPVSFSRSSEVRTNQTISMHIQKHMMHLGNKLLLWSIRLSLNTSLGCFQIYFSHLSVSAFTLILLMDNSTTVCLLIKPHKLKWPKFG